MLGSGSGAGAWATAGAEMKKIRSSADKIEIMNFMVFSPFFERKFIALRSIIP